jgi:hypothetical protein
MCGGYPIYEAVFGQHQGRQSFLYGNRIIDSWAKKNVGAKKSQSYIFSVKEKMIGRIIKEIEKKP